MYRKKKGLTISVKMSKHLILLNLKGLYQKSEVGAKEGSRFSTMHQKRKGLVIRVKMSKHFILFILKELSQESEIGARKSGQAFHDVPEKKGVSNEVRNPSKNLYY
jgi:hypothetical protein